jgi:hypothetical protein
MSNILAIATVTKALVNLLDAVKTQFPDTDVTAKPLDRATPPPARHGLNLFLYRTEQNTGWMNRDMPSHTRPGERGVPPLALNLHYLLTLFSRSDDDTEGHRVLGCGMSILHDHAVLSRTELQNALIDSDLHEQMERIRITYQSLSLDDMFRVWGGLNTEYRLSVAYEVSVVLIESVRPTITPLPVLSRDVAVHPSVKPPPPPFATIETITVPDDTSAAEMGDILHIMGYHLQGDAVTVEFQHDYLPAPLTLTPLFGGTDTLLRVQLPNTPPAFADWAPGLYRVRVRVVSAGVESVTNDAPLPLAPRITALSPNPAAYASGSSVMLTVTCEPHVRGTQRIRLLVGSYELAAEQFTGMTSTPDFAMTAVPVGEYFTRLRVDGVDSKVIDRTATPYTFDPAVLLEVQA